MPVRILQRHKTSIEWWIGNLPLDMAIAVDVSDAAHWFFSENAQEYYSIDEFPGCTPPWPLAWLEFLQPNTINKEGTIIHMPREVMMRQGCLLISSELAQPYADAFLFDPAGKMVRDYNSGKFGDQGDWVERAARIRSLVSSGRIARWLVAGMLFIELNGVLKAPLRLVFYIDPEGVIIPGTELLVTPFPAPDSRFVSGFWPFLFSLSLANCKNVTVETECVPAKIETQRERKGIPSIRYKVLHIDNMRRISHAEKERGESTIHRALHICRGHFARYTPEAPLFGRIVGTFWKPMHVRGNAEFGEVRKSYSVDAPKG